jgi:aspartyl-tRNA(Asn)/glutamyl-tRNA(Gln) amidotransferase subunit A
MERMQATHLLTISEATASIRAGKLTARELWRACTTQIEKLNPQLNAIITPMERPEETGLPIEARSLHGIPVALKDLFETAGVRTTAGALFFKDHIPTRDGVVVGKVRAAGAHFIGKTNTHEIALGVTTVNPHFGTSRNPWDRARIPGGSSGGSAVAVATGMAAAALGTDTGGSIRIPASLCGVVGLKPTYGRVSLRGVFPLSWNLDHAGPMTRCVTDTAILLQVIAGYDEDDPHCAAVPADDYVGHLEDGAVGLRFALVGGTYVGECDPEVLEAVDAAAELFSRLGATVSKVALEFLRDAALANGQMTQADAATYHRERLSEHPELFGADVRQRLETGRDLTAAEYVLARRTQSEITRRLHRLFEEHDVLMLPATPVAAPPIEGGDAVESARLLTRFTAPFNLSGLPAISIPCGFTRIGLPIGLQMVAAPWNEARLLQAARAYEREVDWGSRHPEGV